MPQPPRASQIHKESADLLDDVSIVERTDLEDSFALNVCKTMQDDFICLIREQFDALQEWAVKLESQRQKDLTNYVDRINVLLSNRHEELVASVQTLVRNGSKPTAGLDRVQIGVCKTDSEKSTRPSQQSLKERENREKPSLDANIATMINPESLKWKDELETNSRSSSAILGRVKTAESRSANVIVPAKFVMGTRFTVLCHVLVITNTFFIGLETDVNAHMALDDPQASEPWWCKAGNRTFTCLFTLELAVRIFALGRKFFLGREWAWNLFESFLVLSAWAEELFHMFNLTFVRVLRLSRLVRAGRIIRVVKFFKALRFMVCCIFSSLKTLFWALFLLFLIMYLFSIVALNGATGWLRDHEDAAFTAPVKLYGTDDFGNKELRDQLSLHYRGLPRTLFTLLAAISGGHDWYIAVRPFMNISFFYVFLLLFYILFVFFGVLNVVTGVFLESALQLRDRDLLIHAEIERKEEFLKDMVELFYEADTEKKGEISWEQLKDYLNHERVAAYFAVHELDVADAEFIYNMLDTDHNGVIQIKEFAMGCLRLKGQAKTSDAVRIMRECGKINARIYDDLEHLSDQLHQIENLFAQIVQTSASAQANETGTSLGSLDVALKVGSELAS